MPPINPYAKPVVRPAAAAAGAAARENVGAGPQLNMGPQSQRRLTLQERTHQLQSQSHRKKKQTGQQTLFGNKAFDPTKNCPKCAGRPNSHKGHDPRCWNNKRKSKSLQAIEDQRLRQHFAAPLLESEKCSGKCLTKEAAASFFAPQDAVEGRPHASVNVTGVAVRMTTTTTTVMATSVQSENVGNDVTVTALNLHNDVASLVQDSNFVHAVNSSRAPLPMLAFAKLVVDQMIRPKGVATSDHFNGMTMTVPPLQQSIMSPECHSIVRQKLLHVDWKIGFPVGGLTSTRAINVNAWEKAQPLRDC